MSNPAIDAGSTVEFGSMSSSCALSAIPAVQAFTREELEYARFRDCADDTVVAYERAIAADMWFKLAVGLVTAVGTAAIMWLGARYALAGKMSVGSILVFLSYLGSVYEPLNSITYTASTLHYAAANADRVLEILDTPPDVRDLPNARAARLQGHVRYEDVTFGYEPDRPVLKAISFEARPGEVVAIVHTEKDEVIRVISVRRASKSEEKTYFKEIRD